MADKTTGELDAVKIGTLPLAPDIYDDTLIPVEQQGEAKHMTGAQWKGYAQASTEGLAGNAEASAQAAAKSAGEAKGSAGEAKDSADKAEEQADRAQEYSGNPPVIQGEKQTWWTWDADAKEYKDTEKPSRGNLMYAAFWLDETTGDLYMYTDSEYTGPSFALNGADLEVLINAK